MAVRAAPPRPATMAAWLLLSTLALLAAACGGSSKPAPAGTQGADVAATPGGQQRSWAGTSPAPEFPGGLTWFNVQQPLTIESLRGHIVLLDFWTLGCINCQHIVPDLQQLEAEFGDALVVIGVHSGKYATEHDDDSIREAIGRLGLEHAVVNDPDFTVWDSFGANAWPTLVLIDPAGNLVGSHAGEGVYPLFQPIVQSLVAEFDARGELRRDPVPLDLSATTASSVLAYPSDVAADAANDRLYIADAGHNRVLVAQLDGRLVQAIGTGEAGFADGAADEATFRQPQGLALSEDGRTLYVADTRNHAIRAVDVATGIVRTIAGTGRQAERVPTGDAPALQTALSSPWDAVEVRGVVYIAMAGVHQLWAMDLRAGTVAVYAGTSREGVDDGPRLAMATLAQPSGITSDGAYLYWVDPEGSAVRRLRLDGGADAEVETITGTGLFDYGDEDGQGTSAKLQHAQGIAYGDGRLFVADTYNQKVRAIDGASFAISTLTGDSTRGWSDGTRDAAHFDEPAGLAVAGGTLFVADTNNHLVRTVDTSTGETATLTLSNLGVATASGPANVTRLDLPAQEVAPGASSLGVVVAAPEGYHLNSSAPSRLSLTTGNAAVAELGERDLEWNSDAAEVRIPVPVMLAEGETTVGAVASLYYCREGEEALCFIQQVEVTLPLHVSASATALPQLRIDLPGMP